MKQGLLRLVFAGMAGCSGSAVEVVETATSLTIIDGTNRLELVKGPVAVDDATGPLRYVEKGRSFKLANLDGQVFEYAGEGQTGELAMLPPPEAFHDFLKRDEVAHALARWEVSIDWTELPINAGLGGTDDLVSEDAYHLLSPYFDNGACQQFNMNSGVGARFWPGGNDGSSAKTACWDQYGPAIHRRDMCNQANRRLVVQWCSADCTGGGYGANAFPCYSNADCSHGSCNTCSKNDGTLGYCQQYVTGGWTGPAACAASFTYYGTLSYCSINPYQLHYHQ